MIDIHCHILPGLDDGPKHLHETFEMCRMALEDGVTGIVATPHLFNGIFPTTRAAILDIFKQAQEALHAEGLPLKLYVGADLHLIPDLTENIRTHQALTLNFSRYYLLELPSRVLPPNWQAVVESLITEGYVPIITHPERNPVILRHEEVLLDFIRRGGLCQVTAMSITGGFGREVESLSRRLLEAGAVHFIASDAHSAGWRNPELAAAVETAVKIVGEQAARRLVQEHPETVIANGLLESADVQTLPKRRRFWLF